MDKGILTIGGFTIVVIAIIIGIALSSPASKPPLGTEYPIVSRDHIAVGATHPPYNSNPPTSGAHYEDPAPWGVKTEQLPDETLIHNLEHGGIWISYQPQNTDPATIQKLTDLASRYKSKVVLEPRPEDDKPIALASWGRLLTLDTYDETVIKDFIARNKDKGPEYIPDM